jgi:hypothetical protein
MRLYLDDDSIARPLIQMLRQAGHVVQVPSEAGLRGEDDSVHFLHSVRDRRVMVSHNHRDFTNLHNLIVESGGAHHGLFLIRKDDDRRRDMKPRDVVTAIARIESAGIRIPCEMIVLNHWR